MSIYEMKNVDIRTVDPSTLVDIKTVNVNTNLPIEERKKDFIKQVKNPYCFKCGDIVVKVSFSNTTATLEERLENYLKSL